MEKLSVLIVDDEAELRKSVESILINSMSSLNSFQNQYCNNP